MFKKNTIILFLIVFNVFSQDKIVEIPIKKNRSLTAMKTSLNGNVYIKTSKHVVMAVYKDGRLRSYDQNLDPIYDISVKENDFPGNPNFDDNTMVSDYGKFYFNVTQLINSEGKIKPYNVKVTSDSKLVKQSKLNPLMMFFNDYGYTIIGPEIGRKNYKEEYLDGDLKIFTLRNDDLKTVRNDLKLPDLETNRESLEWYLGSKQEESFNLVAKDDTNDEKNLDVYHIATNKYDGTLSSYRSLKVKLEDKHFLLAQNGRGPESENFTGYGGSLAYNRLFFNNYDKTFSVYGYYTGTPKKQIRVGEIEGIYIHKFKNNGELLWKKKYPFKNKAREYVIERFISYNEIGNKGFIQFSIKKNKFNFILIDKTNGELNQKHWEYTDGYKINKGNLYKKEVSNFYAVFSNKFFKRKFVSSNVIKAFYLNEKLKKYVTSSSAKTTIYYDIIFLQDGDIILKEFNGAKRMIKLLKFSQ